MKFLSLKLLPFCLVFFIHSAESLSSNDTSFRLYKGNVTTYITKSFNSFTDLLTDKYFDKTKLTILYYHGFTETVDEDSPMAVMSACAERGDINCIAADWALLAALPYFQAIRTGMQLGVDSAAQLNKASTANLIDLSIFYLVGHSLGAHLAGYIGRTLIQKFQKIILRITGLDPAGPGYYFLNKALGKGDATAVDIIHTDTGLTILGIFTIPFLSKGIALKTGDADFSPNNGINQPGCTDFLFFGACNHQRSTYLYAESLALSSANSFTSRNALGKKAHMGFNWSPNDKGPYNLQTNAVPLYSQG